MKDEAKESLPLPWRGDTLQESAQRTYIKTREMQQS